MADDLPGGSTAESFFAGSALGLATLERVRAILAATHPDARERPTTSQVSFRRRRGCAYLWRPGQYLRHPDSEVMLSLALPSRIESGRFKEVVHPGRHTWMHHLEVGDIADLDDEVAGWLRKAADAAA